MDLNRLANMELSGCVRVLVGWLCGPVLRYSYAVGVWGAEIPVTHRPSPCHAMACYSAARQPHACRMLSRSLLFTHLRYVRYCK